MFKELVLDKQMIVIVLKNYSQITLITFEKIVEEINDKVLMLKSTLNQIVKMTSKLTKIEVFSILRFDSLNVFSLKESCESNDLSKIVEIREEIILIVDKDFLRKARFTCVNNSRFERLIKTTHQNIVQFNLIFSLRFDKNLDKRLLKIAYVFERQSIVFDDSLFDATLFKNVKNLSHVIANNKINVLSVYFNLTMILSVIVANAISKILEKLLEVKQKTLLLTFDFYNFKITNK